ncbi:VanZ family protein [Halobacteriaceae archaeon GCM10025711]
MEVRRLVASRRVRFGLVVAYAAYLFVASVVDPPSNALSPAGPLGLVGLDKWLHAVAYAGLAFAVAYAILAHTPRDYLVVVLAAVAFGAGIEVVQYGLPERAFDVADMAANAVGAVLATACWWATVRVTGLSPPPDDNA